MRNDILVERLQARMAELKTNALKVSMEAKLGKTAVRDIIAGKSKKPTMDTIARIAIVLNCSIAYLTGDANDPSQTRRDDSPLDMQMMSIKDVIEAGVFKRESGPTLKIVVPVIEHPRFQAHSLDAYLVDDDSMTAEGIRKGDILTTATPHNDSRIPLSDGEIVVCYRNIAPPMITEVSARKVVRRDSGVELHTRPLEGETDIVRLVARRSHVENLYLADDDSDVSVEGIVIRLMRDLS